MRRRIGGMGLATLALAALALAALLLPDCDHSRGEKQMHADFAETLRRAGKLAGLGVGVAPRLIEVVWKTMEYPDDARLGAVFAALEKFAMPETYPPLRTLLDPATPENLTGTGPSRSLDRWLTRGPWMA